MLKNTIDNFKRKKHKVSKTIKNKQKLLEKTQNIADIKSVITKHPKTFHKLSNTIRQVQKVSQVGSNSSLYSDAKKVKKFLTKKMSK